MSKKEAPISALQQYLPPNTYDAVLQYLQFYKVHLTVARERKSILGDYRHRHGHHTHRISVNGNLNPFAFLVTLLHELAHLLTFEKWGHKVAAHGKEWKAIFGQLLAQFIEHNVFPDDIKNVLLQTLHNPAASSCADEALLRILRRYDDEKNTTLFVEDVPPGKLFQTHDGRVFQKGERMRKRFRCLEVATKRLYLFSPVYEVSLLPGNEPV
jgi:hypothetical protein